MIDVDEVTREVLASPELYSIVDSMSRDVGNAVYSSVQSEFVREDVLYGAIESVVYEILQRLKIIDEDNRYINAEEPPPVDLQAYCSLFGESIVERKTKS